REGYWGDRRRAGIKHPTSNIQLPTPNASSAARLRHWMLDVGCWVLDVSLALDVFSSWLCSDALKKLLRLRDGLRVRRIGREILRLRGIAFLVEKLHAFLAAGPFRVSPSAAADRVPIDVRSATHLA